jgi:4-hydroxybenzoyl-CoA thioesterase
MFEVEKTIRFHHCDPAGIVFYPQYLVLCHEVIEDWIERGIGIGHANLLKVRGIGTPTVRLQTEYLARSSFGDRLRFRLGVRKLGNSSMNLSICADLKGEERMHTEQVVVLVDLSNFKPVRIPDDMRAAMQPFLLEPGHEW